MSIDKKAFGLSDSLISAVSEALKGGQVKIDKNHNGKIDGQDFKMLRKEEAIDEKAVSKTQQHAAGAALATQRGEYDGGKKGGAINRMASMKTSELRKFAGTKTKSLPTHKEEVEQVDEISLKTKIKAYAATREPDADYNRGDKVHSQGDRLRSKIVAKHGEKAGDHADRAAYGKPSTPATRSAEKSKSDPLTKATSSTNKMRITKSGVANKQDQKSNAAVIKSRIGKHGKSNLPEDIEQVDELSTDTYHSAAKKAAKKAMGDAQGRSGPIFKKYAGMANKFRDKGMDQEKKEKASKDAKSAKMKAYRADRDKNMEEEIQIDEIGDTKRGQKLINKVHKRASERLGKAVAKGDAKNARKYQEVGHQAWDRMPSNKYEEVEHMEEEIQIDEISKGTLASYGYKAGRQMQGNQPSDPDKFRKRTNREKGSKLAYGKYYGHKVKVPATEEVESVDELSKNTLGNYALAGVRDIASRQYALGKGDKSNTGKLMNRRKGVDKAISKLTKEAAENPMAKQLADKKAAIQKTIVQKKMQVMQSKANKQMSSMKEGKCSCTEGKKSMTCETHGDKAMGMKGGKEPILMNPPLRD
jgi:hypothetical protein